MKYVLLLFLVFTNSILPQVRNLTGKVLDSKTNAPLSSANVLLYHLPDSSMQGVSTNTSGVFNFLNIKSGKYALVVKYLGYQTFTLQIEVLKKSVDTGEIKLEPEKIEMDEVLIVEKMPMATQSGDTTIYNAEAFKVNKDAVAEDLLQKLPGFQVENGKVKAQGEEVKKVYVDGKDFFGDDPTVAVKNLPAEIIEKIQLFDEQSEESKFTGFDDGTRTKAINIITELEVSGGIIGKLLAGYGTEKRYHGGGDAYLFDDTDQLSLIGQLNNTNEQKFTSKDILGVMSGMNNRDGGGSPGGSINSQDGDTDIKALGFNYNHNWSMFSGITGSYFYNNTDNDLITALNRNYFFSSNNGQYYEEDGLSQSENTNHRVDLRFNYELDSSSSVKFIPTFSIQKNNGNSLMNASTYQTGSLSNTSKSISSSDLNGVNFSSKLMYRRKFNKKGRTLSLGLNTSFDQSDGEQKQFSESIFYKSVVETDSINQLTDIMDKSLRLSTSITYTDFMFGKQFITINGGYSISKENNDEKTYNYFSPLNRYSLLDSSLSNDYDKYYSTASLGVGTTYKASKIFLSADLTYNRSSLVSKQIFPDEFKIDRIFNSFLPKLNVNYNISRDKFIGFRYRTSTSAPSIYQMQSVLDNSNPVQLYIGNPDLGQEYTHTINASFSTTDLSNNHNFFLKFSGSYKDNYVGTNTIIARNDTTLPGGIFLNAGSQLSSPKNISGYVSAQTFMTYGLPVDLISCNFNATLSGNYTRTPGILNGINNYSNSFSSGVGAVISSNISTDVDFTISSTSNYNVVKNNKSTGNNDEYFSQLTRFKLYLLFFETVVLQGELTHRYDGGLSADYDPNTYLLNLSVGAKFLSENKAELRFTVHDLLNQNTNITRQTSDYYTQEYSTNIIGRYFLLSFFYNLRIFS